MVISEEYERSTDEGLKKMNENFHFETLADDLSKIPDYMKVKCAALWPA